MPDHVMRHPWSTPGHPLKAHKQLPTMSGGESGFVTGNRLHQLPRHRDRHVRTRAILATLVTLLALGLVTACGDPPPTPVPSPTVGVSTGVPSPTPASTPTPSPSPSPTPESRIDPIYLDGTEAVLDRVTDTERQCLLFSLEEDRITDILVRREDASSRETEAIAGCLRQETVIAMLLGLGEEEIGVPRAETAACIAQRLQQVDKTGLLVTFLVDPRGGRSQFLEQRDLATRQDVMGSVALSMGLCLNKRELTVLGAEYGFNLLNLDLETLRCLANGLGGEGLLKHTDNRVISLELIDAAETCGIDLNALMARISGQSPIPTAEPARPAPTPTAAPAQPAPTPMAVPTPAPPRPTPAPTATIVPAPTVTVAVGAVRQLVKVKVDVTSGDDGTAWMFSYPDSPDSLVFENEVYLPVSAAAVLLLNSVDGEEHVLVGEHLFREVVVRRDAVRILEFNIPEHDQVALAHDEQNRQVKIHVVPGKEFERIVRFGYGCAETLRGELAQDLEPVAVKDCGTLLASKAALEGDGYSLNWGPDVLLFEWEGVNWHDIAYSRSDGGKYVSARAIELHLSDLGLNGFVPTELGNLTDLRHLELRDNRLTGGIPTKLRFLDALEGLYLHSNELTGSIPADLGKLVNLVELDLGGNRLTGGIPESLAELTNLRALWLGGNRLTGGIPAELDSLSNLEILVMWGNGLSGAIPSELGLLSKLRELRLHDNDLTGGLDGNLANLVSLEVLDLGGNRLTGDVRDVLGVVSELPNLRELWFGGNLLTGEIPAELAKLVNLEVLDLRDNRLSGAIPPELGQLGRLRGLYLPGNGLSGAIPADLGKLTNLDSFVERPVRDGPWSARVSGREAPRAVGC